MAGSMFLLPIFSTASLLLLFAGFSVAQTVTGTLFGVAYPTEIVQFANGAYDFPGPVVWIGNHPQIDIIGVDTSRGQTTYSYHDIITQNVGGGGPGAPVTVTQDGILVQSSGGLFFSEPPTAAIIPVVQTCAFDATGSAVCLFNNDGEGDFTITGTKTPFFTFIAALPESTSAARSLGASSQGSSTPLPTPSGGSSSSSSSPSSSSPSSTQTNLCLLDPEACRGPKRAPVGAIVGSVVGGIVLVGSILAALLLYRRRRRTAYTREKVDLDPEAAHTHTQPHPFMEQASSSDIRLLPLPASNFADKSSSTLETAGLGASTAPETRRERRRRLKQMQDTVQELQRNMSVTHPPDANTESQVALQQRQIEMLLGEVERLRAIVARDEQLPGYEE
ncbi:hypothetical protein B0H19DRAFT_1100444 [Mycena capillaripes]|nr:hypothetical protein B0H19DRAFT_1100444 [Mycena capillaripes]